MDFTEHHPDIDTALADGTCVSVRTSSNGPRETGIIAGSTVAYTGPIATRLYAVQLRLAVSGTASGVVIVSEADVEALPDTSTCLLKPCDISVEASGLVRDLLTSDPQGGSRYLLTRTSVNEAVADHPDIVVLDDGDGVFELGPLGLVNGLLSRLGLPKLVLKLEGDGDSQIVTDVFVKSAP